MKKEQKNIIGKEQKIKANLVISANGMNETQKRLEYAEHKYATGQEWAKIEKESERKRKKERMEEKEKKRLEIKKYKKNKMALILFLALCVGGLVVVIYTCVTSL